MSHLGTGKIIAIVGGILATLGITVGILKEKHTTNKNGSANNGNRGLWNSKDPVENLKQGLKNQNNAARGFSDANIKRFTNQIVQKSNNININNKSENFLNAVGNELLQRVAANPSNTKIMDAYSAFVMKKIKKSEKSHRQNETNFGNFTEGHSPGQTMVIDGKRYSNKRVATDEHVNEWLETHPNQLKNNIERYILTTPKFTAIQRAITAVQKVTKNREIINGAKIAALQATTQNSPLNLNLNTRVRNAALEKAALQIKLNNAARRREGK